MEFDRIGVDSFTSQDWNPGHTDQYRIYISMSAVAQIRMIVDKIKFFC